MSAAAAAGEWRRAARAAAASAGGGGGGLLRRRRAGRVRRRVSAGRVFHGVIVAGSLGTAGLGGRSWRSGLRRAPRSDAWRHPFVHRIAGRRCRNRRDGIDGRAVGSKQAIGQSPEARRAGSPRRGGARRPAPPQFGLGPRIRANVGTSARRRRRQRRRRRVTETAEIGVFGGSGFYSLLDDVREVKVDTPYGPPSDSVFLAEVGGRKVAFLPRHGRRHTLPPHKINYRANVWAMRSLGRQGGHLAVRRGLAPAAGQARRLRRVRPVRRPDQRPDRHLLRRPDRHPPLVGRHLRPGPARARGRHDPRPRHRGPRRRHGRRHPGPALLLEVRVEVVQRRRLGGHQHDPVPRGVAVPRARDGGRQHRPDHRLRRRRPSRAPRRSTR